MFRLVNLTSQVRKAWPTSLVSKMPYSLSHLKESYHSFSEESGFPPGMAYHIISFPDY